MPRRALPTGAQDAHLYAHMLTEHPNIVIATPPKRAAKRKKAAALHANLPRIVDARKPSPLDEVDHKKAGEAADRLW